MLLVCRKSLPNVQDDDRSLHNCIWLSIVIHTVQDKNKRFWSNLIVYISNMICLSSCLVHVHTHLQFHTFIYTSTHALTDPHMHIPTYIFTHIHICTCTHTHTYAHTHRRMQIPTYIHTCTCTSKHVHTYLHIQFHTSTYICTHSHMHSHEFTSTHIQMQWILSS